jgi:hypothetical protein
MVAAVTLKTIPFQTKPAELIVIPKAYAFHFAKVLHVRLEHLSLAEMKRQFDRLLYAQLQQDLPRSSGVLRVSLPGIKDPAQIDDDLQNGDKARQDRLPLQLRCHGRVPAKSTGLEREPHKLYLHESDPRPKKKKKLCDAICILASRMRLSKDQLTIRVDAYSSFKSPSTDSSLDAFSIKIDVGYANNVNKNSVAENV